jgi:hypothetical protein
VTADVIVEITDEAALQRAALEQVTRMHFGTDADRRPAQAEAQGAPAAATTQAGRRQSSTGVAVGLVATGAATGIGRGLARAALLPA